MTEVSLDSSTVTGLGSPASQAGGALATRRVARGLRTALPMLPFVIYTVLGLGIPAVAVIALAFRDDKGRATFQNIDTITHGIYLTGFENSLLLSFITAVVPAVLGTFLAYTIETSSSTILRRLVATASGVFANFGGINLTFVFIATIGSTGIATTWLSHIGLNPWNHGFNLYNFWGVALVYMYFQIPLMVLVMTPAFVGLRPSWREASENLGASPFSYWRTVGIPVLMPSALGGTLLLFGSAFAAYATADTLTAGTVTLTPIQIAAVLNGNVIAGETNIGYALGFGMLVVLAVTMILYGLIRKRASKWLR